MKNTTRTMKRIGWALAAILAATSSAGAAPPNKREVAHERWLGDVMDALDEVSKRDDEVSLERQDLAYTLGVQLQEGEEARGQHSAAQKAKERVCASGRDKVACDGATEAAAEALADFEMAVMERLVTQSKLHRKTRAWALDAAAQIEPLLRQAQKLMENGAPGDPAANETAAQRLLARARTRTVALGRELAAAGEFLDSMNGHPSLKNKVRTAKDTVRTPRGLKPRMDALQDGTGSVHAQLARLNGALTSLATAAHRGEETTRAYASALKGVNAMILATLTESTVVVASGGVLKFARSFTKQMQEAVDANAKDVQLIQDAVMPQAAPDETFSIYEDADDSDLLR